MAKKDLFDEIIECLREQKLFSGDAYVSEDILDELFTDMPERGFVRKHSVSIPSPLQRPPEKQLPSGDVSIESMDWETISSAVAGCKACGLCRTRRNTVFGDGDGHAKLMFIGEGPGADEDAAGLPFVGRAGELLTRMINAMQFSRGEVFIANIVKCRPPNNRTPDEGEIASCLPFIKRQIELVSPEVIVLLGATPLKALFNMTGITRLRGKFLDYNGIKAMPTFHPAFLLRNPPAKADVWKDLQIVMKEFGKTYTPPKR